MEGEIGKQLNVTVEDDLTRDLCSLRAALASEDDTEDWQEEDEEAAGGEGSSGVIQHQQLTVLEKLKLCLQRNVQLQTMLSTFLGQVTQSLNVNSYNQTRLRILTKDSICHPKSSIVNYLKSNRRRLPYFVDSYLETPPPNSDTLQQARYCLLPDFHFVIPEWYPTDIKKLKAGVRQKNIELLALPMKNEMCTPGISMDTLKELQSNIRLLRYEEDIVLLCFNEHIDWDLLAYEQFDLQRTGFDCYLRYKNHEQPDLNHNSWKREEEKRLMRLAKEHNLRDWNTIAKTLGTDRCAIQCIRHYQTALNPEILRKDWTKEENKKLEEAIQIYGYNWGMVGTYIGNRSSPQCTSHHFSICSEKQKQGRWSIEEDERLREAVRTYGDTGVVWSQIADAVSTRNSVQCRERWRNVISGKHLIRPWTSEDTEKLLDYGRTQLEQGETMQWVVIGRELNRRDDACRRHWLSHASPDELIKYKSFILKSQKCIKARKPTSRGSKSINVTTVQADDIEEDMMSEEVKEELHEFEKKIKEKLVTRQLDSEETSQQKTKRKRKSTSRSKIGQKNIAPRPIFSGLSTTYGPVIIPLNSASILALTKTHFMQGKSTLPPEIVEQLRSNSISLESPPSYTPPVTVASVLASTNSVLNTISRNRLPILHFRSQEEEEPPEKRAKVSD